MATPSWEDVKKVVDNPAVSHEDKKALLLAYYANDAKGDITGTHNDELEEYLDDYDISWGDGQWQATKDSAPWADSSEDRLNKAYENGKRSADEGNKKNEEHDKERKAGQDTLAASEQRASDGGAGVGNSTVLLDAGAPGLRYFANFLPVYEAAKSIIDGGKVNTSVDNMYKRYDEQRDIDFHKIDIDIVELRQVAKDSRDRQADAEKSMGKLWSEWTGKAADASRAFVAEMSKKSGTHADAIDHVAEVAMAACHTVSGLVNTKARTILEGVRNVYDIAGLSPEQIKQVVQGATTDDEALLRRVAGFVHFEIDDEACDGDVWKEQVRKESTKWLKTTFKGDVDAKWEQFDTICTTTRESVDKAWEELGKQIDAYNTKPFDPPKQDAPPEGDGKGTGNGTGKSGGGGGGTPGGGGGTPAMPEMPTVENPLDKDGDGKPDDPNGGKPDGQKGDEETPETVTIKSGDNEIKITEPDAAGHVQITVDTPNGEPKTYDVDFSNNPEAAKALMEQNGATALGQALAGQGAAPTGAPGTPVSAATPAGGGVTPGAAIPVEAGADGKALIEIDGLSITAEVDPLTGEIGLTVDNGDGVPEEYGVEFGQDEPSDTGLKDDSLELPSEDFRTLPAEGGPFQAEPAIGTVPVGVGHGFTEPVVVAAHSAGTTTASGASIFGGSGGFNGADSVLGGSSGSDSASGNSSAGERSLADTNASQTGQPGSATLPSMQDGGQGQAGSSPTGGGMMGGGMMGGAQQGGSGDTERGANQWRTIGSLFDDDDANLNRLQGVLGDDGR